MQSTVMVIGLGGLGSVTLELLAREPSIQRIVATARDAAHGRAVCNLATIGAMAQGYRPVIELATLDLYDAAAVVQTVERVRPDIVYSSATLQSWWRPHQLPEPKRAALARARFGCWLPVHMTLTMALMRALGSADWRGHVVTAPFPDVVNCVLGRIGLAPTCGVGNLDEIVPKIRLLAARRIGCDPDEIGVSLVAHHALEAEVFRDAAGAGPGREPRDLPPYHVHVERAGNDVTAMVRADDLLLAPCPMPSGPATNFLTAGSTVRLLRALLADGETRLHVPGPAGLPGGYPVTVSRAGVRIAPIPGLALEEAIAINERSHRFDGIERIEADGTVVFTGDSASAMAETLGYDCPRLTPAQAPNRAAELMRKFEEYASSETS